MFLPGQDQRKRPRHSPATPPRLRSHQLAMCYAPVTRIESPDGDVFEVRGSVCQTGPIHICSDDGDSVDITFVGGRVLRSGQQPLCKGGCGRPNYTPGEKQLPAREPSPTTAKMIVMISIAGILLGGMMVILWMLMHPVLVH